MNLWVLFILNYTIYMTFYWHLKASPFMPCNLSFATISISIYFKEYMNKYIWHVKRFTLIMTCLSWCTFTNILYCNITVASWHLSIHDVKPVLCHNFIHIEAYLFDDLKNDEKPSRCLNLHLIKTCLSWCTIANQPSLRGITCPLLFREMVCPTTLNVVDRQ